jgi:hypothetical protein
MANNLFANTPFSGTASKTILFADIPAITSASIGIIFKVGSPLKSYIPGRSINPISGFEKGAGYYISPLQDLDLNDFILKTLTMQTLTDAATIDYNLAVSNLARVAIAADRDINIRKRRVWRYRHSSGRTRGRRKYNKFARNAFRRLRLEDRGRGNDSIRIYLHNRKGISLV